MGYVFLYKENDTDDRDCVVYIKNKAERFECNHYFGNVILHGSCFCNSDWPEYNKITTCLTKKQYKDLQKFNKSINELGYSIKIGDERYLQGIKLCEGIQPVFDKLNGEENEELFEQVIEEEKEYLTDEYNLSEKDIEHIFNNYCLDYRDRSIVSCVFEDAADCGYEEAVSMGYINNKDSISSRYFDYEKFGEDLVEESDRYLELDNGRIVCLNY